MRQRSRVFFTFIIVFKANDSAILRFFWPSDTAIFHEKGGKPTLKPHKEIPGFLGYPVEIGAGVLHVFGVATHKGAKQDRVFFGKALKLGREVRWCGGDGYFRQLLQAIVFDVCQDTILATQL